MTPLSPEAVAQMVADLTTKAAMINMGEKIAWGSDSGVMDAAADMLTTLAAENATLRTERRMIVSHATMGTTDGDGLSLNAVSVQITQLRNELYNDAKAGAEAELATLRASEAAALERVRKLDSSAAKCLELLDGLVIESGRSVDYGEEDTFRMGEWFDADDMAAMETLRQALTPTADKE